MKDLRFQLQSGLPNEDVRTNVQLNLEGIWAISLGRRKKTVQNKQGKDTRHVATMATQISGETLWCTWEDTRTNTTNLLVQPHTTRNIHQVIGQRQEEHRRRTLTIGTQLDRCHIIFKNRSTRLPPETSIFMKVLTVIQLKKPRFVLYSRAVIQLLACRN